MKNLSKGMLMAALITGTLAAGTAYAAEAPAEFTLDAMVVTATRMETKDLEVPATVNVVTAKDIEKTGSTTVFDALTKTIGVTNYAYSSDGDDFGSSQSRIYLRGLDKGALVMVNGAPINLMNYASLSGIPVETVEKIEVVKGAGSVMYGAEALGGVINIITKKGGAPKTSVSLTGGNYLKKWNVTTMGDGYIASIGRDYKHDNDHAQMPRQSAGTYRYVYKSKRDVGFLSAQLAKDLTFNFSHSEADPMYASRKIKDNTQSGSAYRYNDRKNVLGLVYDNKELGLKSTLSYNEKRVNSETVNAAGVVTARSATSNYKASNLFWDTQKIFTLGEDSLVVGFDMKHEKYDQRAANIADNERNNFGIYASYNKKFNNKFNAVLGLRGQYYDDSDFEKDHKVLLPQLQTTYKMNDTTSWFTNIGKAFEVSAINSHTSAGGTAADVLIRNTPKPESGWNYETGIKKITDSSSSKLSVFYMDIKNKFKWVHHDWMPDKQSIQENVGKFENFGVEAEYKKVLGSKWSYNVGATFQDPKSEDNGKWTQDSARLQFNAGVDYTLGKLSASLTGLYVGNREMSSYLLTGATAGSNPDHRLRDRILVNTSFSYKADKNNSLVLNLNNILDRRDPLAVYEYYDLPFNWTLTYQLSF